jgi:dolichyl-phosphate-mannose--protein O-mannosyl transferase
MMHGMMGGPMIVWTIVGVLVIVILIIVILKLMRKR